jgi:WD40 repeat protein
VNLGLAGAGFSAAQSPRSAAAGALMPVPGSPFTTGTAKTIAYSVAFHPSGTMLACANNAGNSAKSSVTVFTVQSSGALKPLTGGWTGKTTTSVAFSPDGKLLAATNYGDNTVSVFSVGPPFQAVMGSPFAAGGNSPYAVAFDPGMGVVPQQPMFATADLQSNSTDTYVSVFASNAGAWQPVVHYPNGSNACGNAGPAEVAFHPGGDWLASANSTQGTVSTLSVGPGGVLKMANSWATTTGCNVPVNTLAFSPNGPIPNLLATGSGLPASVQIFKFAKGGLTKLVSQPIGDNNPGATNSVTFHPIEPLLAVADSSGVSLFVVTPNGTLTPLAGSPVPVPVANNSNPKSLAFSPDGKFLAVGTMSWASQPKVWMFKL